MANAPQPNALDVDESHRHSPTIAELESAEHGESEPEEERELELPHELGMYTLEAKLGEGAMARVYRARHRTLNTRRAIKLLRETYATDERVLRRFIHEGRVLARIRHDNLVRVFDLLETSADIPGHLVMEFLQGETLEERLIRLGGLSVDTVLSFALQLTSALIVVHDSGVAHRDIKPANIFLTRLPSGEERIKLLDFGIAKGLEGTTLHGTRPGTLVGTPAYMAPEQVLGEPVDHRVDIYQVGLLLCEMLTGRPPCEAEALPQVLMWHTTEHEIVLPNDVPAGLARVIRHCLTIDRDTRLGSMKVLHQLLANVASGSTNTADVLPTKATTPDDASAEQPRPSGLSPAAWVVAAAAVFATSIGAASIVTRPAKTAALDATPRIAAAPTFRQIRFVAPPRRTMPTRARTPTAQPLIGHPRHVSRSVTKSPF